MKIKLKLKRIKGNALSFAYCYYLAAFIYAVIEKSDSQYSEILHNKGYPLQGKAFKLFTFSQLQAKQVKIINQCLYMQDDEIGLYLSSPVDEWIRHFIEGVFAIRQFHLEKMELAVADVQILPDPDFGKDLYVRALSPVTVSTGIKQDGKLVPRFLDYREPLFKENIRRNLINKYTIAAGREPDDTDFNFTFDEDYIRRKGNVSKLLTYKGTQIRGYAAPLTLSGSPGLKRMAYYAGIGDRNSNGFGCLV